MKIYDLAVITAKCAVVDKCFWMRKNAHEKYDHVNWHVFYACDKSQKHIIKYKKNRKSKV